MNYITNILEYIDQHIREIPFPDHLLEERFSISSKKLYREFTNHLNETPHRYLMKRKMELAYRIRQEDPSMKVKDVIEELNMKCSLRAFHSNYTRFVRNNHTTDETTFSDDFDCFWKSRDQLNEILLRFVLRHAKYDLKEESLLHCWLEYPVENTMLQCHPFGFDTAHTFNIWLNPDTDKLTSSFIMKWGFSQNGMDCAIPNKIDVYTLLFASIHDHLKDHENYVDITQSIHNFNNYLAASTYLGMTREPTELPQNAIEINHDSAFIKATDSFYNRLKKNLVDQYQVEFSRKFRIDLFTIKQINEEIRSDNYKALEASLSKVLNSPTNTTLIDLLFCLIDHPYLRDLDISTFPGVYLDKKGLETLKFMSSSQIQCCLLTFKKEVDRLCNSLDDDALCEYDFQSLAAEIITNDASK